MFEETSLNEVSFSFLLAFAFDHHLLYFQLLTSLKSYTPFSIPQFSTVIKVFSEQNQISCFWHSGNSGVKNWRLTVQIKCLDWRVFHVIHSKEKISSIANKCSRFSVNVNVLITIWILFSSLIQMLRHYIPDEENCPLNTPTLPARLKNQDNWVFSPAKRMWNGGLCSENAHEYSRQAVALSVQVLKIKQNCECPIRRNWFMVIKGNCIIVLQ